MYLSDSTWVHAGMCVSACQIWYKYVYSPSPFIENITFIQLHQPHSSINATENPSVSSALWCALTLIFLDFHPANTSIFIHLPVHLHSLIEEYICSFLPQVGFYLNHHLILHRQPGCLPNSSEDGGADRISRWPGRSDRDRVWHHAWRIYNDLLSGQRLNTSLHMIDCLCS